MAGTLFDEANVLRRAGLDDTLFFASGAVATRPDFVQRAREEFKKSRPEKSVLLIHNGDKIPSSKKLDSLTDLFDYVFAVNVLVESAALRALPIGLENASLNNNGRLEFYLRGLENRQPMDRARLVMSSFNPSTNPTVREAAAKIFRQSRFGFDGVAWKRKEYRDALMDTCFVVSPPGNGPDCHRTWEAMYMGAVPVLLEGHLAPSLREGMPVLEVPSYQEFVELDDDALRETYLHLSKQFPVKGFAKHWIQEFSALS